MDGDAAEASSTLPRNSRASTGCVTCRLRKVKCDEHLGGCNNCSRLGFKCSFAVPAEELPTPIPQSIITTDWVPKKRVRQACEACHSVARRNCLSASDASRGALHSGGSIETNHATAYRCLLPFRSSHCSILIYPSGRVFENMAQGKIIQVSHLCSCRGCFAVHRGWAG
ncbi:hypothetical protein F5Y15DRAFT_136814 [Xylariaceae sp. FL0016]|nr:hypothetical protein F5Y15DRAFT_136814 [Xylariaceae sp. FL0016]